MNELLTTNEDKRNLHKRYQPSNRFLITHQLSEHQLQEMLPDQTAAHVDINWSVKLAT